LWTSLTDINWLLWVALAPVYFLLEALGTKNTIATTKLWPIKAANTGTLMYLIAVVGSYICVKEGLINMVPIAIGAWLGQYYSVVWELKLKKKNGKKKQASKV
jgi:hypothetical protein